MMIEVAPIQAKNPILSSVLILANIKPMTAAQATNPAVHIACVERAFNEMDMLNIADPATKVKSNKCQ